MVRCFRDSSESFLKIVAEVFLGDREIRSALLEFDRSNYLETNDHHDPLIIDELGFCQGLTRIDLADISSQFISGYEIKSARESLARLPQQFHAYARVCDHPTVVVATIHLVNYKIGCEYYKSACKYNSSSSLADNHDRTRSYHLPLIGLCYYFEPFPAFVYPAASASAAVVK